MIMIPQARHSVSDQDKTSDTHLKVSSAARFLLTLVPIVNERFRLPVENEPPANKQTHKLMTSQIISGRDRS